MKINYKKAVAALTAVTTIATIGVGTISASATDLDAVNERILNDTATVEDKFVAEYAYDDESAKVAEYVANSLDEISLDDAEKLMVSYVNTASTNSDSTVFNYPYYSVDSLSDTDHYMAAIVKNPSKFTDHNFDIFYRKQLAHSTGVEYTGKVYKSALYWHGVNYDYIPTEKDLAGAELYNGIVVSLGVNSTNVTEPSMLLAFGFDKKGKVYSENDFRNLFVTKEYSISYPNAVKNDLAFETLSLGDIDHDGEITESDTSWILKYIVGSSDLEFTFSDGLTHYTKTTSQLAGDFNEDGSVNIGDAVAINKYINS